MRTSIQINIPKPCHEDWSKMTPQEKGRHCKLCKKTVFDFTNQTDETIVKTFKTEGKVCGRFKNSQLNRELVLSRKEQSNYLSFVASTLFAFLSLGTNDIEAQDRPISTKIASMLQGNLNCGKVSSVHTERIITGTITAASDGLPLPGVNVIVKGTSKGVQTDFDGNFTIRVKSKDTLIFSFLGMKEHEVVITHQNTVFINLEADEEGDECIEYVVAGYTSVNYYDRCEAKKRRKERRLRRQQIRNGNLERSNVGKFLYRITNVFRKVE